MPHDFFERFPCMKERRDRVLLSDEILRKSGYLQTMKRINEN